MKQSMITVLYTLTPTHCGTGHAMGAIDLPIAREVHTGLPVLPASGLKGALAARSGWSKKDDYFGKGVTKDSEKAVDEAIGETTAGSVVFMEGRLVLYPVRSLQTPFVYATCPLILERLERDARALSIDAELGEAWSSVSALLRDIREGGDASGAVRVCSKELAEKPLVLEDLLFQADEVAHAPALEGVATFLANYLPTSEAATQQTLKKGVVLLSNQDFVELVSRVVPVQARIRLDEKTKTTSAGDGNLWYEEVLPSDCVFVSLLTTRSGVKNDVLAEFKEDFAKLKVIQVGGNETVGEGLCFWSTKGATT